MGQGLVETRSTAPFGHTLRVRYAECDPQGVVFNANYLAYFDIGITELFRAAFESLGGYRAVADQGLDFVVAEAGLRYHRPAHFDDELTLEVGIARLGTTSMTTSYRVVRAGDLLVEGTLRHVLVDQQTLAGGDRGTKTAIPGWMRERLAPFAEAG